MNIAFYSHNIDFAGTWRSHERIAEVIQHHPEYNVKILFSPDVENNRLEVSKNILHKCEFLPFSRSIKKDGPSSGYCPITSDIEQVVKKNNIQLLHFARSGYFEWPFNKRICPIQVETNIFGYEDNSPYLDGTIFISRCLGIKESDTKVLIPNPIPSPSKDYPNISDLRSELGIHEKDFVLGRIGRPSNFTPIALEALDKIKKRISEISFKYLIIGACEETRKFVRENSLEKEVIMLDCTNDDSFIERFHKTIDVFAHYRSDGETFGTAIAQSMINGKPVITHYAGMNGPAEWIGKGLVCVSNSEEYSFALQTLLDKNIAMNASEAASNFAKTNFDQETIGKRVVEFYEKLLRKKFENSNLTGEG